MQVQPEDRRYRWDVFLVDQQDDETPWATHWSPEQSAADAVEEATVELDRVTLFEVRSRGGVGYTAFPLSRLASIDRDPETTAP